MLTDESKKKVHQLELMFIVILIIAVPLLFFKPSLTGFVASDTKAQILNMVFTESQALELKSASASPVYVSSFSLSGEIIGNGDVAVYLANGETRSLVYSNVGQKKKASPLTGAVTGIAAAHAVEVEQNGTLVIDAGRKLSWPGDFGENSASGSVTAVCMDSCYLSADTFTASNFELQVFVESGTTFKLQEVLYTIG
jgi:competence protein ComGC